MGKVRGMPKVGQKARRPATGWPATPKSERLHTQNLKLNSLPVPTEQPHLLFQQNRDGTSTYLCLYLWGHRPGSAKTKPSEVTGSNDA